MTANTTTWLSPAIQSAHSIEAVAALVNDGTCEGLEGVEFTPEQLAGQWAHQAAADADGGDTLSPAELEAHLDFLREAGATFDTAGAVAHALAIAEAQS